MRRKLVEYRAHALWRLGLHKNSWTGALSDELTFWENALKDGGRAWNEEEFRKRTDPNLELQNELTDLMVAPPGAVVRILDVGAGPLTRLGKKWRGRQVEIVAVDPLGPKYTDLLAKLSIKPAVPTIFAEGEDLLSIFPRNHFDLAYASNALDHSHDPLQAIRQMLLVVKPSCYVYLWHFANEGMRGAYQGLHQWNFDIQNGDFIIKGQRETYSLASEFKGLADLHCEFQSAFGGKVVVARLRKLAPS